MVNNDNDCITWLLPWLIIVDNTGCYHHWLVATSHGPLIPPSPAPGPKRRRLSQLWLVAQGLAGQPVVRTGFDGQEIVAYSGGLIWFDGG